MSAAVAVIERRARKSLAEHRLRAARARIAETMSACAAPSVLGSIRLRPHQRLAVTRVTRTLARDGGCLLADDVGRGKTYVALAIARQWERPLVVVPASLRSTWQRAMERACVPCSIVTHEALSRGAVPAFEPDGVIVDESHRFRSPEAKRHAALARVAAFAPILLLSATPLQNGTRDLAAQLALFLGSSAFRRSEAELSRCVVRGSERDDIEELPSVAPPVWLHPALDDGAVLRAILTLPPPARPFDAGDAGVLRTIGLVRAWASSRATLSAALQRRMRAVTALEQCAVSGLSPSTGDLRAWQGAEGDVQLAFAPLLVSRAEVDGGSALLAAVGAERAALDRLNAVIRGSADPDDTRVAALRALRAEYPEAHILAFSEFATTVRAYYAALRADAGVGMLTANEARIASGRLPRGALLDRFAPAAQGARDPLPRERVMLLLATDLLSEGVNLQDASIVVHLDLPWNPARLAQRLGRVRRPGGAALVHSYLMSPPAAAELLLRVDARLRAKLARAEQTIGRTLPVLPALAPASMDMDGLPSPDRSTAAASAAALGAVADQVAGWRISDPAQDGAAGSAPDAAGQPLSGAVTSVEFGWLAALDDGTLLARCGSGAPGRGSALIRAVALASGDPRPLPNAQGARALAEAREWLERERLTRDCGFVDVTSPVEDALERRLTRVVRRAPRHERANVLTLAAQLRDLLGQPRSLGAERDLAQLMAAHAEDPCSDVAWLERSLAVATRTTRRGGPSRAPCITALIVFGPDAGQGIDAERLTP